MRHIYISFFILLSILFSSCSEKIVDEDSMKTAVSEITATLVDNGTKTELADDEKNILWSPDDEINIFYEGYSVKFKSTNTKPEQTAVFRSNPTALFVATESTVDADEPYFVGTYPYNINNTSDGESATVTIPDAQIATCGSFAPNSFVAIGRSKDTNIAFYNVCGGIRFTLKNDCINQITLSGNDGEILAGTVKVVFDDKLPRVSEVIDGKTSITLTVPGGVFKAGEWYYISVLPTVLKKGINFVFDRIDAIGACSYNINTSVKRSTIGSLETIDKNVEYTSLATNLSNKGTANCYVVSKEGRYKFDGNVKGGSSESIDQAVSAEVLWESFGTDVSPKVGEIIERANVCDGFVSFATNQTLRDGNAVIAVKDNNGNILWSWHIWVCKDFDPIATAQVYNNNAGTFMDRNLGATSTTPGDVKALGLQYQWGRKDPFLNTSGITSDSEASSTISWPSPVTSDASYGTISYSVAHPTTYILNGSNSDWYYSYYSWETDDTRWQTSDKEKGIYDPCPVGWRVPDGGSDGGWAKAFSVSSYYSYGPWDEKNKGMDFGSGNGHQISHQLGSSTTIWYPATSMRDYYLSSKKFLHVGECGSYWSCTPDGTKAYYFEISNLLENAEVLPCYSWYRASGYSVRCVAE